MSPHRDTNRASDGASGRGQDTDYEAVKRLLGRDPQGSFEIVLRRDDGSPVVLANGPLLDGGRPMPTRYWLADRQLVKAIGQLESGGGVKAAESEVDPAALQAAHDAYAAARDQLIDATHHGPRPSGGVGGTRKGVKCLHAHYANFLMGADDPVGDWIQAHLVGRGAAFDPSQPGQ
ncbi:MAG: DUF501 domain-containing protein [Actinomycetia bacterium]|nr:DUF501 domain-containing protein [Actinomycetes bacterium]